MNNHHNNSETTLTRRAAFVSIREARAVGFRNPREWEYDGELIAVNGQFLVRNAKVALSNSEWQQCGYRVKSGETPHCIRSVPCGRGAKSYPVYRDDQVSPKRPRLEKPSQIIDILAAVWGINRRAKRCRVLTRIHYENGAHGLTRTRKDEMRELYRLKAQALHYLHAEALVTIVGYHRFPTGNWAEVMQGGGYSFHRPCPPQDCATVVEIGEIDAKRREPTEPRLKDAIFTVQSYLEGKRTVDVYQWPAMARSKLAPVSRRVYASDFDDCDEDEDGLES